MDASLLAGAVRDPRADAPGLGERSADVAVGVAVWAAAGPGRLSGAGCRPAGDRAGSRSIYAASGTSGSSAQPADGTAPSLAPPWSRAGAIVPGSDVQTTHPRST